MKIESVAELVLERTAALCAVPAPPLEEQERSEVVANWWRSDGLSPTTDGVGNLVALVRSGTGPGVVVAAHLDTVFGRDVIHGVDVSGGRMCGPGVGDNTVAVASLSTLAGLLPDELRRPVWIAATVGEEGLGNLAGARNLVAHPPGPMAALVAVEGNYLGRVATTAVGSVRWRILLDGPGGHAWEASDAPNVVQDMARISAGIEALLPAARERARSSFNVGQIEGGEAVNARARRAWMTIDIRSASHAVLEDLERGARSVVDRELGPGVQSAIDIIGTRPAGSVPDTDPLVVAADQALEAVGITAVHVSASTDANAAGPAGIPAIAVGITTGSGEHTLDEWIDMEPVADGLIALADTIVRYDQRTG